MKRRSGRWTACLLAGVMLFLTGCAGKPEQGADPASGGNQTAAGEEQGDGGERTMGRYLEEEILLPEDVTGIGYPRLFLQKLDTGELALVEAETGMYLSSDYGESWSMKDAPWLRDLREAYISHLAIAPNGAAAAVYSPPKEEGEESGGFHPEHLYVDPEGNVKPLEVPPGEEYIHRFFFGKDSRLYGSAIGGNVYEMDPEAGTAKKLFDTEGLSDYICFTDSYLIDITTRGLLFYDLKQEILTDGDRILEDFIAEQIDDIGGNADAYSIVMEPGEQEDAVYFACSGGLYRHVIGGTAVEQILEGSLSYLGDPQMQIAGMAVLPDHEFAVLYTNGKMYRYVYNPDIPTIPEEQVSIYSLRENYAIRQAASLYQRQHPEVYVHYEVGLAAGSGMTAEDAIKNLNTKIMSGSGPDLLVLDGLPRRSYEEKGVLMDLSGIAESMTGEDALFSNLVEACREDGKLWYIPIRFRLPLLVGDRETVERAAGTDLTKLADTVEALRKTEAEGMLLGLPTEGELLRTLGLTCSGAWTDPGTGAIDEAKLTEFLQQAKRIYQAETAGIGEEELVTYKERFERSMDWSGALEYFATSSTAGLNVAQGYQKIGLGVSYMMSADFNMISTLADQEADFGYGVWNGQIANGFLPRGMIGISSGAGENELALSFFRYLYGRQVQDQEVSTGFPINRASFEQLRENPREGEGESGISIGSSGADGEMFSLDILWVTDEHFEALKQMAESARAVCTGDEVIEEVVYETGQKALNGSASVESTVEEIVKRAAIYLAE